MGKHESSTGVSTRDVSGDMHPGKTRPTVTTSGGSDANASGSVPQSPKK